MSAGFFWLLVSRIDIERRRANAQNVKVAWLRRWLGHPVPIPRRPAVVMMAIGVAVSVIAISTAGTGWLI
jgi:hypothetical protein